MLAAILSIALLAPVAPLAPARVAGVPPPAVQERRATSTPQFGAGLAGFSYVERSEAGLEGATFGGSLSFTARINDRLSAVVEGGRARFTADDQEGHRDFFLSGLVGIHFDPGPEGAVVLLGATLLHAQLHSHFGNLGTNQAAFGVGLDYVWVLGERITLAASWRTDIGAGIIVHRPGATVRVRF